jgi:hypothetical protein
MEKLVGRTRIALRRRELSVPQNLRTIPAWESLPPQNGLSIDDLLSFI